jgi:hypothetical protein
MRQLIAFVLAWLGLIAKPRFLARYRATHPSPAELTVYELAIVRSGNFTKWACFLCPCGCGQKIALSLAQDRRPSWRVSVDWLGRPTVAPSVWQTDGCYSHFWIKRGSVEWCPGTGHRYEGFGLPS